MKVSIIIPSYNREKFILETLKSVVNQTSNLWNCFVVDDGSTDRTVEIITKFISEHSDYPIHYLVNSRTKGAQGARNTGIINSDGELLLFLDSDDILEPNCIENRLSKVDNFSEYDLWAFPVRLFNEKLGDSSKVWNRMNKQLNLLDRFLIHDAPWQTLGCLWRRKAILEIGMWDEKVTSLQDWDAHIQAVLSPDIKIWLNPDEKNFDAFYRVGSYDSISKKFATRKGAETNFYLVDKTLKTINKYNFSTSHLPALRRLLWIKFTLISIADNNLGVEFYNKYKDYWNNTGFNKSLYNMYALYRFDMKKPKLIRGIFSKLPEFFPIKNIHPRENTCMNLTMDQL
ncbi:glycosyltransferase family 2 protein [Acinetobacter soli]|uniref:glycosyltransferase family 2 protein n=1 Tax=Acinetobacter soli TaxID=487316 RepID=UPI002D804A46|nr:glycosyltransferase family 2 protein [Acinetobacter soli]MEB4800912.1 glycosyltransferase family 2 protein [Acinetobacter soli]